VHKLAIVFALAGGVAAGHLGAPPSHAQDDAAALLAQREAILEVARRPVDPQPFAKPAPYRIGLSAGYLSNSWILFASQYVKYEASLHAEVEDLIITDANWNPAKQVADIEDLISQDIDLLLYWPVDEQTVLPALQKAVTSGIPTVNVGYNFMDSPSVTGNAYVDQWAMSVENARHLAEDLGGQGKVFAMLPIAGSSAAVTQLAALEHVLKEYPDIELVSVEYGDWNRAKAKQLTENLLQRFPRIDGAFSPAGQMSMGILEAFDEAGRLDEVTMSPGDEYNGWTKWVARHGKWGSVTSGLEVGRAAVRHGLDILMGKPVTNALVVETRYLTPAEAAELHDPERPDDWWPTALPPEFLPQ
jgi:ABC-type sugar transport system substrate-binding protein